MKKRRRRYTRNTKEFLLFFFSLLLWRRRKRQKKKGYGNILLLAPLCVDDVAGEEARKKKKKERSCFSPAACRNEVRPELRDIATDRIIPGGGVAAVSFSFRDHDAGDAARRMSWVDEPFFFLFILYSPRELFEIVMRSLLVIVFSALDLVG